MSSAKNLLIGQTVFISYASVDHEIAEKLAQVLKEADVEYFLDQKDINWGVPITTRVQQGIAECSAIIVVISPASLKSQWVPFEVGHAMGAGKVVLPFVTHPSIERPGYLADLHYVASLKDVELYFKELVLETGKTGAESTRFGAFSGQYIAFTWGQNGDTVLVEEVRCRQVSNRLEGTIHGVAFLMYDRDKRRFAVLAENKGVYRFTGFVDQRLFVVSYQTLIPAQHSAGVIAIKADSSGLFCDGSWAGLVGDTVQTSSCQWTKLHPPISALEKRSEFLQKAMQYITVSQVEDDRAEKNMLAKITHLKAAMWKQEVGMKSIKSGMLWKYFGKPNQDDQKK